MKPNHSIEFRKLCLYSLIIVCGLVGIYLCLISLVTLWVGLEHMHQRASWVPTLAGGTFFIVVFWTFFRLIRLILRQTRENDLINI